MALPARIPVKLSSEDAGAISMSRVVSQEMALAELFDRIVGAVGKDAAHVRRVLRAGTLLDGGTRFRWDRLDASEQEISSSLARFPDPDPGRPFDPSACSDAVVIESSGRWVAIPKAAAAKRRLFRRRSFWDELMHLAAGHAPRYVSYSYRDRADRYRLEAPAPTAAAIRASAVLLVHNFLARQVRDAEIEAVEFLLPRGR